MPPIIKLGDQEVLVDTSSFPEYAKFPFDKFNPVQSRVFEIFNRDANIIVAASTSSGKTVTAEMIAAYEIRVNKKKAIYLGPMKALAKEKIDDWTDKKHHFSDLKIAICTGDYRLTPERKKELEEADIILMTNEMLSSRCRHYTSEGNEWLKDVGVLIVDELHLAGTESRGSHCEVGLLKFSNINPTARLVGLSATLPNVEEIASWFAYSLNQKETYLIDSKYRPVPLGIHWETYEDQWRYEANEESKIEKALEIIDEHPGDKFLVFVHTKKTGEKIFKALKAKKIVCEYHNADLDTAKRVDLEQKFKKGNLRVLVATSTLAWGCPKWGTLIDMADGSQKKVEDVNVNDLVLSFDGTKFVSKKVLCVADKTLEGFVEIELHSGESIIVSQDHKFLTNNSWTECLRLNPGKSLIATRDKESNLPLSRVVKEIRADFVKHEIFRDLEVEDTHNYVSNGILSHNCNLPARRVIILGVHRGLEEVEWFDITQEVGRSGRMGIDPRGDAYILVPEKKAEEHIKRLSKPHRVESQLLSYVGDEDNPHYKTLAFHLVNEIHHGDIQTKEHVYEWYEKTLARSQNNDLDDTIVEKTLDLLIKCGAIKVEEDLYKATSVGKIASLFYFSPFDVSDLKRNFAFMFKENQEKNDLVLSMALGNVDTFKLGFASNAEKDEMETFASEVRMTYGNLFTDAAIKTGYAYFCLLNGINSGVFGAISRNLQADFPRTTAVLNALDTMACKWDKRNYLNDIQIRGSYGVKWDLVDLCKIENIGRVRAEKLWNHGVKTIEQVANNPDKVQNALGMSVDAVKEICESAKRVKK